MPKDLRMKYRALADLAHSQVYTRHLKPELEEIKAQYANSEKDLETIDEAAVRDIRRSQTIKIINRIIRFVEKADEKAK